MPTSAAHRKEPSMAARAWLRKRLPLLLSSLILLSVSCPPMVVDSLKTGITRWVSGSMSSINLEPFMDALIATFGGPPSLGA
jgi:hypothetical protein